MYLTVLENYDHILCLFYFLNNISDLKNVTSHKVLEYNLNRIYCTRHLS